MALLLIVIIYPLIVSSPPLEIIGQGTFFPGIYTNITTARFHLLYAPWLAAAKRLAGKLSDDDRLAMKEWLVAFGLPEAEVDLNDTAKLLNQWNGSYDPKANIPGMTNAKRNYYSRLNQSLKGLLSTEGAIVAAKNAETGALEETGIVNQNDYVNIGEVANVRILPLGTDNFGRDILTELVRAAAVSLQIGLVAGLVATTIGLTLGLLAGYVGGMVDDIIMFFTNLLTVIPTLFCWS